MDQLNQNIRLWMIFPAKKNTVLKEKMNLVDDLPVDVLADITIWKHLVIHS